MLVVDTRAVAMQRDRSQDAPSGIGLRIPGTPRAYLWFGIATAVVLTAVYLGIEIPIRGYGVSVDPTLRRLFDLDAEATVPVYYSGAQLLVTAIAFATVGTQWTGARRRDFNIAALALVLASLDEIVSLHEEITTPLSRAFDFGRPFGHSWWIIPGFFVAAALAWVLRNLLRSLGQKSARLVVVGTAVFFFGALGLESISSWFDAHSLRLMTEIAGEESAEMIGVTIVLYAVLPKIAE